MMKSVLCLATAIVILLGAVLSGCTARQETGAPPAQATEAARAGALPAKEGWQAEWEALRAAAKKEGTATVYTSWTAEVRIALRKKFEEDFGVGLEFATVSGGQELAAKLEKERSAGLLLADVIGTGLNTATTVMKPMGLLGSLEPVLLLPEAKDTKVRAGGRLFLDTEQKYYMPLAASFDSFLSRNSELVKDAELKAYADVLDPKWKGRIIMNDPTHIGGGNNFVTMIRQLWGTDKARDYLRQLTTMEPFLSRDYRLQAEWLARGKGAVGIGIPQGQLMTFQKVGAPIAFVKVKEGGTITAGGPGGISLPAGKLPHPNASKVFINWMLTKEGQTVFSKAFLQPAWRLDVSTEGFEDLVAPPGATIADEESGQLHAESREIAAQIMAALLK
ncbi:MAG: extracellular solute-binding protein [Chloroflexi bacterium]|nr:extracellular solute-binding protein [Chloroflexota bacterium]